MSEPLAVSPTWRQIERALAEFLRHLGVKLEGDGMGEMQVEVACWEGDDAPERFSLSDLAKYLERELASP